MANLKDIRDRIKSVKSIQQVTNAMKMVAAAKMRRAQENMEKARPYSSRLAEMLESLIPEIDRSLMPELNIRTVERTLFVVITADRGMAGAFNHNVLRKAHHEIDAVGKIIQISSAWVKKPAGISKTVATQSPWNLWTFGMI